MERTESFLDFISTRTRGFDQSHTYTNFSNTFAQLSMTWGWGVDKKTPDFYDWLGAIICLVGVSVMLLAPRQ